MASRHRADSPVPRATDSVASAVMSIRRLVRALRLNAQRTHAVAGLTAAQLFVLQQLGADAPLCLNDLAAKTLTDRSSVADVVARLESGGLVRRGVDPADRRRAAVEMTAKGRQTLTRAPDAPTTALIAGLRALTAAERSALARSLTRLNDALGVGDEPATMLFADDEAAGGRPTRRVRRRR